MPCGFSAAQQKKSQQKNIPLSNLKQKVLAQKRVVGKRREGAPLLFHEELGGGFIFFIFSPRSMGK